MNSRALSRWGAPVTYVVAVVGIATVLVGLLVRSPDTKANFQEDPGEYDRTLVALLGSTDPYPGLKADLGSSLDGLYVGAGCASCHGLTGEGNSIGPDIRHQDFDHLEEAVRDGAFGMPAYDESRLTERELRALTTYLEGFGPSTREADSGESGADPATDPQESATETAD